MQREEIVTNGCSGSCCAKFTLPCTINDLHKMKAEHNRVRLLSDLNQSMERILCDNGYSRYPLPEMELDKLLEMLIPLGETEISPQDGTNLTEYWKNRRDENGVWDTESMHHHFMIRDDKVFGIIFTCKHFDTINRICNNYENRPDMCKVYGRGCEYIGCDYNCHKSPDKCDISEKVLEQIS